MRKIVLLLLNVLSFSLMVSAQQVVLSAEEKRLYDLINEYRAQHNLSKIPLSLSLTYVAQEHAKDLHYNRPFGGLCNMHSWSNKGNWSSCCYTADHSQAKCMWNKPREMTGYQGNGYEIAHGYANYSSYQGYNVTPEVSLNGWKSSPGHNAVILNQGQWATMKWQAIGIGIYKDFAVVWFGEQSDTQPLQIKKQSSTNNQNQPSNQSSDEKEEKDIGLKPSMGGGNTTPNTGQQKAKSVVDVRNRLTFRLGIGLNYNYGNLAKSPRSFDGKVFSTELNSMIGYRLKENHHQRSNVVGVFVNYSSNTSRSSDRYLDAAERLSSIGILASDSSSRNLEVEIGFLGREWFRLSAGTGTLSYKGANSDRVSVSYYLITPGFDMGIRNFRFYMNLPILFGKDFENPIFRPSFGIVGHLNFLYK